MQAGCTARVFALMLRGSFTWLLLRCLARVQAACVAVWVDVL